MIVLIYLFTFLYFLTDACLRCSDRSFKLDKHFTSKLLQSEYEQMYIQPKFKLEMAYAILTSSLLICLTFSAGMPILYFIFGFQMLLQFWGDKYLLFRYFSKTNEYTAQLSKSCAEMIQIGILIHFLSAIIMYANNGDILKSE